MLINKTENEGCLKNNNFKGGFVMTELQVKTQKGSLKKFLAMFLAFCVCLTTVFVDGAFAQAAGGDSSSDPSVITVTAGDAVEVSVTVGEKKDVTSDKAIKAGWSKVAGDECITISGTKKEKLEVSVEEKAEAKDYSVKAQFVENVASADNAWSADAYEVELTVKVTNAEGDKVVVSPSIAIKDGEATVTLTRANPSKDLKNCVIVTPDDAVITWGGGSTAVRVNNGVVTATANASNILVTAKIDGVDAVKFTVTATGFEAGVVKNDSVTSVTVSPKTLAAKAGETKKVTATVALASDKDTTITKKLAKTVTWKSDNDKVATVDASGNVKAVAVGTAKITAASTADSRKFDVCTVTVTAEDKKDDEKPADTTVAVSGITLNAKTIYLKTGTKFNAKAAVAPAKATNKKVTWTSNKKNIATVNANGVITAKKKTGKATITAKAGNKSAKITVNVVKKAKKTTSVKLSKSKVTLTVKDNVALAATLSKGATSKVKWTTSDKKVASVKDGVVTAKKKGVAVITATADGKSADCVVTVKDAKGKKAATLKVKTKKISVKVKKTKKIKVTLAKKDSVKSYVSSNKKIATVSKKGVVTGKKKGKATIIVTTKKGAVATIPVTVK